MSSCAANDPGNLGVKQGLRSRGLQALVEADANVAVNMPSIRRREMYPGQGRSARGFAINWRTLLSQSRSVVRGEPVKEVGIVGIADMIAPCGRQDIPRCVDGPGFTW